MKYAFIRERENEFRVAGMSARGNCYDNAAAEILLKSHEGASAPQ